MAKENDPIGMDPSVIPDQRISNALKLIKTEVDEVKERIEEIVKAVKFLQDRVDTLEVRDVGLPSELEEHELK